jgi:hypothetical protein
MQNPSWTIEFLKLVSVWSGNLVRVNIDIVYKVVITSQQMRRFT